jgi:hypothetical protein
MSVYEMVARKRKQHENGIKIWLAVITAVQTIVLALLYYLLGR